jgi:hypothetical protein
VIAEAADGKAAVTKAIETKPDMTVETQRRNIMLKLELPSSAGEVRYAIRNKLVEA